MGKRPVWENIKWLFDQTLKVELDRGISKRNSGTRKVTC